MASNQQKHGFNLDKAIEGLDALHDICGLDAALFSPASDETDPNRIIMHRHTEGCRRSCPRCEHTSGELKWNDDCLKTHVSAGMLSDRYGGKYVYVCPEKKLFIAAPIICRRSLVGVMILGPSDVTEEEDEPYCYPGFEPFEQRSTETFHQLTYLLSAVASSLSDGPQSYLRRVGKEDKPSHDSLEKTIKKSKRTHMKEYPIASEEALFKAVKKADPVNAVAALDRIFAYFFTFGVSRGDYLDIERATELVVIISRAALDSGVDSNIVFSASEQCKKELRYMSTNMQAYRRVRFFVEEATGFVQSLRKLSFDDQIYRVQSYVQAHLSEEIHLEQVAESVGFSPAYLSRVFKEKTGTNFVTYVNQVRIDASKADLRTTDYNVSQVAQRCGFESVSYFTRVFKKLTGVTPGYYRLHRGQIAD